MAVFIIYFLIILVTIVNVIKQVRHANDIENMRKEEKRKNEFVEKRFKGNSSNILETDITLGNMLEKNINPIKEAKGRRKNI